MREKHSDKKNAFSLLEAANRQMIFTLTLIPTDESSFNIIRNVYECFRMLGDAILVSQGKISEDHIEPLKALEGVKVKTDRPVKLVDSLRRMRHGINYYGYQPMKVEAEDALSLANACFKPLWNAIHQIVEKSEQRRFL